ncbi:MAG TPA: glycoside hydrolase family 2 TIM barrel-domain containing protein [Oscillospiraceae bacterium]|nr:glycoside hydrolase family 2 TIM barrel-domain containing protein [Oscillospiraceae bacterium]
MELFHHTQNGLPEWQANPGIFSINRLAHRSDFSRYSTLGEALQCKRWSGERYLSLNGEWEFAYYPCPAEVKEGFQNGEIPFGSIEVPSNPQVLGYGTPQYCNVQYPWESGEDVMPPYAPEKKNNVFCYRKRFFLPQSFDGKEVILHFAGVDNCFYLWINGHETGFSKNSFNAAEFDITQFLHEGENLIAVQVMQYSDSSWLEDQDFFRLSGIFRDVFLYCMPQKALVDFGTVCDWSNGSGNLTLYGKTGTASHASLYDGEKEIFSASVTGDFNLSVTLEIIKTWSAEKPNLYTIVISADGGSEFCSTHVGFRRIENRAGVLYLNGAQLKFVGADRHEFDAKYGRAITHEIMESDVLMMKRHNINAVRTSHYPNHPYFLELCDKYGIYVIDETNMETHGTWGWPDVPRVPGDDKLWEPALLDRVEAVFQRDKNRPSVILWSLGNESNGGTVIHEMYKRFKSKNDGRLVHYEGGRWCSDGTLSTDLVSAMYSTFDECEKLLKQGKKEQKPVILCEYAHAMGNSCGDLDTYTDLFYSTEGFVGGLIWDFVDQAILKTENGKTFLGFGGDFGDDPNDAEFSGDGLITADRRITPKLIQVKHSYRPAVFSCKRPGSGEYTVKNRALFTDINEYDIVVTYTKFAGFEQTVLASQRLAVNCPPGQTAEFTVFPPKKVDGELQARVELVLRYDTLWAKAGFVVACDEFITGKQPQAAVVKSTAPKAISTYGNIYIEGQNFTARFSRRRGELESYRVNGRELLAAPVRPIFWRAPTDNENGWRMQSALACWRGACDTRGAILMSGFKNVKQLKDCAEVEVETRAATFIPNIVKLLYRFYGDGSVEINFETALDRNVPCPPKVGMQFILTGGLKTVTWLGMGPHDNYCDRVTGCLLGVWEKPIDEMYFRYLNPQESGNETGVRMAKVSGEYGLSVTCDRNFELNVGRYTAEQLEFANHWHELPETDRTVLQVNYVSQGVGGDLSWGETGRPHEKFLLKPGKYKYQIRLTPQKTL